MLPLTLPKRVLVSYCYNDVHLEFRHVLYSVGRLTSQAVNHSLNYFIAL